MLIYVEYFRRKPQTTRGHPAAREVRLLPEMLQGTPLHSQLRNEATSNVDVRLPRTRVRLHETLPGKRHETAPRSTAQLKEETMPVKPTDLPGFPAEDGWDLVAEARTK